MPARRRALVVVISDFIGSGPWKRPLAKLAQRHDVVALRIVDAADDVLFVAAIMGSRGLSTIVTTHAHPAHVQALADLEETTFARTVAHPDDSDALPIPTAHPVRDSDVVEVGDVRLTVVHLPGHTPGSIALLYSPPDGSAPHLFTGDALLRGGPGGTDTHQDRERLLDALLNCEASTAAVGCGLEQLEAENLVERARCGIRLNRRIHAGGHTTVRPEWRRLISFRPNSGRSSSWFFSRERPIRSSRTCSACPNSACASWHATRSWSSPP